MSNDSEKINPGLQAPLKDLVSTAYLETTGPFTRREEIALRLRLPISGNKFIDESIVKAGINDHYHGMLSAAFSNSNPSESMTPENMLLVALQASKVFSSTVLYGKKAVPDER